MARRNSTASTGVHKEKHLQNDAFRAMIAVLGRAIPHARCQDGQAKRKQGCIDTLASPRASRALPSLSLARSAPRATCALHTNTRPISMVLPANLERKSGDQVPLSALSGKVVALYFGAQW